ncbi:uncharacterized protein LOC107714737, partial [Tachysurus ichikawai]
MSRLSSLIRFYFTLGLRHWEILLSLSNINGIVISASTLCRHLKTLRLFRRKEHSDLLDVAVFLQDQLNRYDLKDSDDFSGDFLDKSLKQFTCLEIIERELQDVVHLWHTHRIRPSRNAVSPCGRPVMMYTLPQLFGAREHLKEASQQKIQVCREECRERGPYPCDNTVFDICCLAMAENNLHPPTSPEEAIDLYMFIRAYTRTQI